MHSWVYICNPSTYVGIYIWLPTVTEAQQNMDLWRLQTGIPGIFGAIDSTHIAIKRPMMGMTISIVRHSTVSMYKVRVIFNQILIVHSCRGLQKTVHWYRSWLARVCGRQSRLCIVLSKRNLWRLPLPVCADTFSQEKKPTALYMKTF